MYLCTRHFSWPTLSNPPPLTYVRAHVTRADFVSPLSYIFTYPKIYKGNTTQCTRRPIRLCESRFNPFNPVRCVGNAKWTAHLLANIEIRRYRRYIKNNVNWRWGNDARYRCFTVRTIASRVLVPSASAKLRVEWWRRHLKSCCHIWKVYYLVLCVKRVASRR